MIFSLEVFDMAGAGIAAISTLTGAMRDRLSWALSLISCSSYCIIFFYKSLPYNLIVHSLYLPLTLYGAYQWHKSPPTSSQIKFSSPLTISLIFTICGMMYIVSIISNGNWHNDSITSFLSVSAMYLMANHSIECWILWFLADIIYLKLYMDSHMPFSMLKSGCYLVVSLTTYFYWYKIYRPRKDLS